MPEAEIDQILAEAPRLPDLSPAPSPAPAPTPPPNVVVNAPPGPPGPPGPTLTADSAGDGIKIVGNEVRLDIGSLPMAD